MAAATYVGHASKPRVSADCKQRHCCQFSTLSREMKRRLAKCAAPPHYFAYAACDETHGCPGPRRHHLRQTPQAGAFGWFLPSLVGKIVQLDLQEQTKIKLTQVTRSYCATTQGDLQHSSCRSRETNEFSLGFTLVLRERFLTGITESFPTFNHTTSWTKNLCAPGACATTTHECNRGIVRRQFCVAIRFWTLQHSNSLKLNKKWESYEHWKKEG